jgi:hypothetical protein
MEMEFHVNASGVVAASAISERTAMDKVPSARDRDRQVSIQAVRETFGQPSTLVQEWAAHSRRSSRKIGSKQRNTKGTLWPQS